MIFHFESEKVRAMRKETWRDRILRLMAERGLTMKELSKNAGRGETAVRDILKNERSKSPRIDTLAAVAAELGVSLVDLLAGDEHTQKIPLIGFVSAGDGWSPIDGDGPFDYVDLNIAGGEPVALGVRGDSMTPVFRDGDVLIGTKKPTARLERMLESDCIVETKSGERLVKILMKGNAPGRFTLRSYNRYKPDIENVQLNWAAPIAIVLRAKR